MVVLGGGLFYYERGKPVLPARVRRNGESSYINSVPTVGVCPGHHGGPRRGGGSYKRGKRVLPGWAELAALQENSGTNYA